MNQPAKAHTHVAIVLDADEEFEDGTAQYRRLNCTVVRSGGGGPNTAGRVWIKGVEQTRSGGVG